MKKILLAGTAIVGAAVLASPAQADLKLDLGGHFRGYGVFADNDEANSGTTSSDSLRDFEFKRDFEVHFSGETTTDSGLTVGVHAELDLGNESEDFGVLSMLPTPWTNSNERDPSQLDEAYMYFSGGWGRVNFGSEDGVAYLLQVAAPSADSNVDGMRVYVQGINSDVWDDQNVNYTWQNGTGSARFNYVLGYDNATFRDTDRISYLTPKWNGFQAGISYAPKQGQGAVDEAMGGMTTDDDFADYEDLWEIAARWDGEFEGFGVSLGGGYASADPENGAGNVAGTFGSGDITSWDVGATVSWNDFSFGAAYLKYEETGGASTAATADEEVDTWVVGAAWDNGPYHIGASWYNTEINGNAFNFGLSGAAGDKVDVERITVGGGYTYGPGMTFRGAVAFGDAEENIGTAGNSDFTQVTIGTDVNF